MKKKIFISAFFLLFILFAQGCKDESSISVTGNDTNNPTSPSKVKLTGKVYDVKTNLPIDSAIIQITGGPTTLVYYTDVDGAYNIDINLTSNVNLTITAYKNQYLADSAQVTAVKGTTVNVPDIKLSPANVVTGESGAAASITVLSASPNSINVKESGGNETTIITFQVLDSLGNPINIINADTVFFKLGSQLGGEFIYPQYAITDQSGKVYASLTAGSKSGVIQLYAEMNTKRGKVISKPVYVTINGGLPDLNHLSIGPSVFNFPGLDIYGRTEAIYVVVGDKFGNPVKEKTSVYFTTTGGIIEGSLLTDTKGGGSVNLISGLPEPVHPTLGPGFATITASTADENLQIISRTTEVLFSGYPIITVNPVNFNIPNGGQQMFSLTVADRNGNPLAADNKISVTLEGENAGIEGDVSATLPDTKSKDWTHFNFVVYDTQDTVVVAKPLTIKIKSEGSNGKAFLTLTGTGH